MSGIRLVLSIILFVSAAHAHGVSNGAVERNGISLGDPRFEATLREKYVHSGRLPDAVAFQTIIGTLSGINEKKPALALSMIRNNMRLDDPHAAEFLAVILDRYETVTSETDSAGQELICSQGIPRVAGQDVYAALDAMDDAQERIAGEHLASFRQDLSAEEAENFDQWLLASKKNTVHLTLDHRKSFELNQVDPDAHIALLCGR